MAITHPIPPKCEPPSISAPPPPPSPDYSTSANTPPTHEDNLDFSFEAYMGLSPVSISLQDVDYKEISTYADFIYENNLNFTNNETEENAEAFFEETFSKFKEVYLDKSTDPEVVALEEKMNEMGIKITFNDDLEFAQRFTQHCTELYEKGVMLPKEIILMDSANDKTLGYTIGAQGFNGNIPIVFLEKDIFDKEHYNETGSEIEYFEVDTPEGIITHEFAHYQNFFPAYSQSDIAANIFTPAIMQDFIGIANEVSLYATEDFTGSEFVAEVYSGLINGETYSEDVMQLYENLAGPTSGLQV